MKMLSTLSCLAALAVCATVAQAQDLKTGDVSLQSAGPLAFGPQGILLVGDPKAAAIYAIDTGDASGNPGKVSINVKDINVKAAKAIGADKAAIADLAVNPLSGNVYLSVQSSGPDGTAGIVKVDGDDKVSAVSLKDVRFSKAVLADAPDDKVTGEGRRRGNRRLQSITDLAFMDGQVLVSGQSKAKESSSIHALSFPFSEADPGTSLEIFHSAHGRVENQSAPNTFVPFNINGEPTVLAAYTCTPLVKFPVKDFAPGKKLRGTTVAELGNHNQPMDMVVYSRDGKNFLLIANSDRGVMKVSTDNIGRKEGITEPVRGGGTKGQSYVTVKEWSGITQLDKLNDTHAVVIRLKNAPDSLRGADRSAAADLMTVELP